MTDETPDIPQLPAKPKSNYSIIIVGALFIGILFVMIIIQNSSIQVLSEKMDKINGTFINSTKNQYQFDLQVINWANDVQNQIHVLNQTGHK